MGERFERVSFNERLRALGAIVSNACSRCSHGEGRNGFGHVDPVRSFSREFLEI